MTATVRHAEANSADANSAGAVLGRSTRARAPRLFGTLTTKILAIVFVVAIFAVPLNIGNGYVLTVLTTAAIAAIAATGLNLLTGYAGQISLGHAFFVGAGAFSGQVLGGQLGLPFLLWLPLAALFAGALGALVAPFALRLRGPYLAIVSLGLVYIGIYAARNLPAFTGGLNGTVVTAPVAIGPLDFTSLQIGPFLLTREQGMFILCWVILALVLLATANIVRSRSGRAMQAIRDHDLAAEVLGVRRLPSMMNAFIVSSVLGGLAGGLLGVQLQYIRPENFGLDLSIQYVAIIVIGGLASIWGPVLGALFIGLVPVMAIWLSDYLPFISKPGEQGGVSVSGFGLIVYGVLIVVFLLFRRGGLISFFHRPARASRAPAARGAASDPAPGESTTQKEGPSS
ncbi:branched-chain amino acid ABC transporter permease [Microbacterium sp. HD4P20]|uniref:branched-chain amino acid ABC transporter permease n=1 Tax=Microbacterium sp. HD4P20 TaxID=2864874 RepID=UPI001C6409CD|nr:branched-chain amino acid ABC transporter permease [Microbacterium sp. HD4P20]MCP2635648.1 branched-chain amino acid ABC transporter permease [Microbacterium sp. HD4P20]